MNFFYYQPELFYSANIITARMFGGYSYTLLFGVAFLLFLVIAVFVLGFNKLSKNIIIVIITLVWLPGCLQFFTSSLIDFTKIINFIDAPEDVQIEWRYCNIDNVHKMNAGFCFLYSFTKNAAKIVPHGSTIHIFTSNIGGYLNYYLYDYFKIVDQASADYFFIYKYPNKMAIDVKSNKLYLLEGNNRIYLGDFIIVKAFNKDAAILKRIKN